MNSGDGLDGPVYYVCIQHFSCFTTVCSQNINKQIVNIEDETLTDYSFLSRYHYIEFVSEFPSMCFFFFSKDPTFINIR